MNLKAYDEKWDFESWERFSHQYFRNARSENTVQIYAKLG